MSRGLHRASLQELVAVLDDDALFRTVNNGDRELRVSQAELARRISTVSERRVTAPALSQRLSTLRKAGLVVGDRSQLVFRARALRARAAGRVVHMASVAGVDGAAGVVADSVTADGLSLEALRVANGWSSRGTAHRYRQRLRASVTEPSDAPPASGAPAADDSWVGSVAEVATAWADLAGRLRTDGRRDDAEAALALVARLAHLAVADENDGARAAARPNPQDHCGPRDVNRNNLAFESRGTEDVSTPSMNDYDKTFHSHPEEPRAGTATPSVQTATSSLRASAVGSSASTRGYDAGRSDWSSEEFGEILRPFTEACQAQGRKPLDLHSGVVELARGFTRAELDEAIEKAVDVVGKTRNPAGVLFRAIEEGRYEFFPLAAENVEASPLPDRPAPAAPQLPLSGAALQNWLHVYGTRPVELADVLYDSCGGKADQLMLMLPWIRRGVDEAVWVDFCAELEELLPDEAPESLRAALRPKLMASTPGG